tara:strand:+ start:4070 stop:4345 length:276 start_codon:yes stop_codon:yes gene_type:complete
MNKIPFYKHFKLINNVHRNFHDKHSIEYILERINEHAAIIQFELNKINELKMELIEKDKKNKIKTYNAYLCDDNYDYDEYLTKKIIRQGGL